MTLELILGLFILTTLFYYVWKFLFLKKTNDKVKNFLLAIILGHLTAWLTVYIAFLIWIFNVDYYPKRNFDRHSWKNEPNLRYEMSEDLVSSQILIGKNKQQVIYLLGDEQNQKGEDKWSYLIGTFPSIGEIDPNLLYLEYQNNRVVKVSIH